jgi:D-arginine dehydrogenase
MHFDFAVIGGGVAGLSVAAGLALRGRVALLEREARLALHSSGRSVAMYSAHSGNPVMRALTRASRAFFDNPPIDWSDRPLLSRRGMLIIAPPEQSASLEQQLRDGYGEGQPWEELSGDQAAVLVPILAAPKIAAALYDSEAMQIEVDRLTAGYRRVFVRRGGIINARTHVRSLRRLGGRWLVEGAGFSISAQVIVNAAGAWADEIAAAAGLPPIVIEARRRTVAVVGAPSGITASAPMTTDTQRTFYFRPAAAHDRVELLMSPCDETRVPPSDVVPDAPDVKDVLHRVELVCRPEIRIDACPVRRSWAGLRSFTPDEIPVVGFDPLTEDFLWVAGQGGHGLQAAPALADLAVALIAGEQIGDELAAQRVDLRALAVRRPRYLQAH